MKLYLKIMISLLVILVQLLVLDPYFISAADTTLVMVGMADLISIIPQLWYIGKWIYPDVIQAWAMIHYE